MRTTRATWRTTGGASRLPITRGHAPTHTKTHRPNSVEAFGNALGPGKIWRERLSESERARGSSSTARIRRVPGATLRSGLGVATQESAKGSVMSQMPDSSKAAPDKARSSVRSGGRKRAYSVAQ